MDVDESLARQWLASVSYYRLSGYWYTYRILPIPDDPRQPKRLDIFIPGTTFTQVTALYEFDRKLRTLIHDGMERIEVAMRARIGELLVAKGALSYKDASLFRDDFDHESWLRTAQGRVERARKRNHAIAHYAANYDDYPFWVLADVLDFLDISQLYDGLLLDDQRAISESYGFTVDAERLNAKQKRAYYRQDPLARWLEQFTVLRNTCAHHGRVWNRYLTPASSNAFLTIEKLSSLPRGQSDRLYGALLVMAFMLTTISPGTSWPHKVCHLIKTEYLPLRGHTLEEMGFPSNWQDLPLWRS
ncbi:Abi-like protein [Corynebacterium caspium DSM 44850]|nr:Abi-like protein [Corynebacterium caspium DSM 44850]